MNRYLIYIKSSCETCVAIKNVLVELSYRDDVEIINQEAEPIPGLERQSFDESLERSFRAEIESVPTVIQLKAGVERVRHQGWVKAEWSALFDFTFDESLPTFKPGCASKTLDPGRIEKLQAQFQPERLQSRRLTFTNADDIEVAYDQGWSDGLPVVPPTPERVHRMLGGTTRAPSEVVGKVPPDYGLCTIEKIAVNEIGRAHV